MSVVPLSLNRASTALQSNRAHSNLTSIMTAMSKSEQQAMTQRQYQYGSDSPFNAITTLKVQNAQERKTQNAANLTSTQTFLGATDSTLSKVTVLSNEARAAALNAINTLTSPSERAALADTVKQSVSQLFALGNNSFNGRYLFAGSTTGVLPFLWGNGDAYAVQYAGTEHNIYSWSDTDLLSKSNVSGSEAFGAISTPVKGRNILASQTNTLKNTTLLTDILGTKASLNLQFSGNNNNITIKAAHNGATLNGLQVVLQSDAAVEPGAETAVFDAGNNTVFITVNPEQTTADGMIAAIQALSAPPLTAALTGDDRTSGMASTCPILPGASVNYGALSGGSGEDFDTTGLQIINGNQTFTISFEDCLTVGDMLAKLNKPVYGLQAEINSSKTGIDIRSRVSGADFCIGENGGITAHQLGVRTTDTDTLLSEFDFNRGVNDYDGPGTAASALYQSIGPDNELLLTARNEGKAWNGYQLTFVPTTDSDGKITVTLDEENRKVIIGITPGATTACDVVTAFNNLPEAREYFDLTLDQSLGLNNGSGVVYDGCVLTSGGTDGGVDFVITRNDGVQLEIDIKGAKTLGDILHIINEHPDNTEPKLIASLNPFGNGIQLYDASGADSVPAGSLRVDRTLLSTAAIELGLIDYGQEYRIAQQSLPNEPATLTGIDPNPKETESLFTALIRLQRGIETGDEREIKRATDLLDAATEQMTNSRANVGVMQKSLDNVASRLTDEQTQYESVLQNTLRIDYTAASLNYLAQQLQYQGSMQITSMMLQMSLLNYL